MRTGDTVRDGQGNAYQVGQLLGRGLWGKTFLARRETTDQLFVLKVPLGPEVVDELLDETGLLARAHFAGGEAGWVVGFSRHGCVPHFAGPAPLGQLR